jgi:hypothetical protein
VQASLYPYSRFVQTSVSVDLDINLLVLACGTGSIGEDLLRDIWIRRILGLAPMANNCAGWHILLSKRIWSITSSVGLPLFGTFLLIKDSMVV